MGSPISLDALAPHRTMEPVPPAVQEKTLEFGRERLTASHGQRQTSIRKLQPMPAQADSPRKSKAARTSLRSKGPAARSKNSFCSLGYRLGSSLPYSSQFPTVSSRFCSAKLQQGEVWHPESGGLQMGTHVHVYDLVLLAILGLDSERPPADKLVPQPLVRSWQQLSWQSSTLAYLATALGRCAWTCTCLPVNEEESAEAIAT